MTSDTPKSKGEMIIERLMQELDPSSERYRILDTAKRFKSSWVELGEKLLEVQKTGVFRDWGYESFEDYCSREIRIKKPTAEKLTLAYRFLEKEEPELLARRTELKPLPDFRSVDLLRRAREEEQFGDDDYSQLRRAVVEEERGHPTVVKRFRELAPPREEESSSVLKAALAAARRLESALQRLPDLAELAEQAQEIVTTLEGAMSDK